jgi:hypothetical protein
MKNSFSSGWGGTDAVPADPVRDEKGRTLFDAPW